jgi:hypothetical protein
MARRFNTELSQEELGRFRYKAAALVRFMLRARAKGDPQYHESNKAIYKIWTLSNISEDELTLAELLHRARLQIFDINEQFLHWESGSLLYDDRDPLADLKHLVGFFMADYHCGINEAIRRAESGQPIDWQYLARWEDIPAIRKWLDQLPDPRDQNGPDQAGQVRWGDRVEPLQPVAHRLLQYLWDKADHVPVNDAISAVWVDEKHPSRTGLKSALHKINECLGKLGVPWTYHLHDDQIVK